MSILLPRPVRPAILLQTACLMFFVSHVSQLQVQVGRLVLDLPTLPPTWTREIPASVACAYRPQEECAEAGAGRLDSRHCRE